MRPDTGACRRIDENRCTAHWVVIAGTRAGAHSDAPVRRDEVDTGAGRSPNSRRGPAEVDVAGTTRAATGTQRGCRTRQSDQTGASRRGQGHARSGRSEGTHSQSRDRERLQAQGIKTSRPLPPHGEAGDSRPLRSRSRRTAPRRSGCAGRRCEYPMPRRRQRTQGAAPPVRRSAAPPVSGASAATFRRERQRHRSSKAGSRRAI